MLKEHEIITRRNSGATEVLGDYGNLNASVITDSIC